MSRYEGCCDTCKFCWQDFSVGASECGCPYYEEDTE